MDDVLGVVRRGGEVDDRLPRLVLDLDELGGVLGRVAAVGDDDRDRVTHVADVADRERRGQRHLGPEHGVPRLAVPAVEVLPGEHGHDAGGGLGRAGVDGRDRRPRDLAADEGGVEHARHRHVVDVLPVPRQQARVLLAGDGLPDEPGGRTRQRRLAHVPLLSPYRFGVSRVVHIRTC